MNWDAIGAVGEAVGAAGVIISLLYLAVQIRGDAREKRVAMTHDRSMAPAPILLAIANNPGLSEIYSRGIRDFGSLDEAELPRLSALLLHMSRMWEDQFFQWSEGYLESRIWLGLAVAITDFVALPGWQGWWRTRSHWFSDQFQAFIEEKIAEGRTSAMYAHSPA